MKFFVVVSTFFLISSFANGQVTISGTVHDPDNVEIPGVNVLEKGTTNGTSTDSFGKFSINCASANPVLVFSFIGLKTLEIKSNGVAVFNVILENDIIALGEVVVSVGRGEARSLIDTPLPVDNILAKDLVSTGQPSFDKALQYRVPSFNTVNTPVNDATSLLDPYELRNLGPSRTLILINGKRKNLSSLIYTTPGIGRGETGADLSAIPQDAIKRIEILRDGASAQYGSDAIAGVMNIILKDRFDVSTIRLTSGITSKGDGINYGLNYNSGANIGEKGYINYHLSFLRQQRAIRSGRIDPVAETDRDFGFGDGTPETKQNILNFLEKYPDGRNVNGTTDNTSAKFLINAAIPLFKNVEFYTNVAFVYRKAFSFANYRQPYWNLDQGLLHTPDSNSPDYTGSGDPTYNGYVGYLPTFEGDLVDYNGTLGLRSTSENGWKQDMSVTVGGNKMLFTVNNTVNQSLGMSSPISFKPGGYSFNHLVGNVDISKSVSEKIFVGFGTEFRAENFKEIAGDTASYSKGGAESFPGILSKNAVNASRYNFGAYADFGFDITDNFFIGLTGRSEKYSDFGNANVGKISSRVKLLDSKLVLRSSISNGFRAPTLHQYNLSLNQTSFLSQGGLGIEGLANNYSREAAVLGIPKLKAEKSINFTGGLGFNPNRNLSITLDYYYIEITNRIIYSALVKSGTSAALDDLLVRAQSTGVSFFVNGAHTKTSGLDLVTSYRVFNNGDKTLKINLAGNYQLSNKLVCEISTPAPIANAGGSIFSRIEQSQMLTSRPKYKVILGTEFIVKGISFNLNNSLIGPAYFSNTAYNDFGQLENLRTSFDPKILTDLSIGFDLNKTMNLSLTVSNLFNVYPHYKIEALNSSGEDFLKDETQKRLLVGDLTFNGRYPYQTYEGSYLNQLGTTFLCQFTFKLN
jgi:iron complex outermembrane receptor protein